MTTVVAFYTRETPYEEYADLLMASVDATGMTYHVEGLRHRGSWDANTALKPEFLRNCRDVIPGPLLYVDVDAFVHRNCAAYFDGLAERGVDFAAHWFAGPSKGHDWRTNCACLSGESCSKPHRLLSGTLFLGDTEGARNLLQVWCEFNRACRDAGWEAGGGQRNLWAVVTSQDRYLRQERLPGRFCYVFDKARGYPEGEPRVIEHTIASRDHRAPGLRKRRGPNKARERRTKELQRTLEER